MSGKVYVTPNPTTMGPAVEIDPEFCVGCNICVEVCRSHVFLPAPTKGKPPIVMYPDECWFCGCCVEYCKEEGAIRMVHPLSQRVCWKRKDTGAFFRIGMANPPPPNKKPLVR